MTTRQTAEALLFDIPLLNKSTPEKVASDELPAELLPTMTTTLSPTRRRIQPIYCPRCASWVEVRLQPARLCCTGCGLEARL